MAQRFKCDKCKGTIDVADMAPAPVCSLPGARKGRMEQQHEVVAEVAATGCLDAKMNADSGSSKEAFKNRNFEIPHFVPDTRYGNFNCKYSPKQGTIEIRVFVHIDFQPNPNAYFFKDWSEKQKLEFKTGCQAAVEKYWNGTCYFKCVKVGWEDLPVVRPSFVIQFVENKGTANYSLTVQKDADPFVDGDVSKPKCNAGIIPKQITYDDIERQTTGFFQSFSIQTIKIPLKATSTIDLEQKRLEPFLTNLHADRVNFATGSANLTLESLNALSAFAAKLKPLPKGQDWSQDYMLPGTPLVPLLVKPMGATPELCNARAEFLQKVFKISLKVDNPIKVLPPQITPAPGKPAPVHEAGATMAIDKQFGGALTVAQDAPNYEYNTFVHEFGHMLGLPDEYQNETGENTKARLQQSFARLAQDAGVALPPWGKYTASMMSSGTTMMRQHYLTIWNALTAMTHGILAPPDWQVMMKLD